jgi:prepilin peptidase CpaA
VAFGVTCTPGESILGFLVGFALTFILFALRAVQGGDVKLLAGVGAWLGPVGALQVFCVEAIVGALLVVSQAAAQGRLRKLVNNSAVLAVNLVHVKDVGLDHVAATGRSTRTVEVRLPYAVPLLVAVLILVARNAAP